MTAPALDERTIYLAWIGRGETRHLVGGGEPDRTFCGRHGPEVEVRHDGTGTPLEAGPHWLQGDLAGNLLCAQCYAQVDARCDPITGDLYLLGACENCDRESRELVLTGVESGGCTDRLRLCPTCRDPFGERR